MTMTKDCVPFESPEQESLCRQRFEWMFCEHGFYPQNAERGSDGAYVDAHLRTLWIGFRTAYIWDRRWWRDDC